MKTAISIPDDLFEQADEVARKLGKSRSALYQAALSEYLARHDPDAITDALNAIADELAADRDEFTLSLSRRALARSEW